MEKEQFTPAGTFNTSQDRSALRTRGANVILPALGPALPRGLTDAQRASLRDPALYGNGTNVSQHGSGSIRVYHLDGVTEVRDAVPGVTEKRLFPCTEIRLVEEEGKPTRVEGYAAVFNSPSQPLTIRGSDGKKRTFIETIAPGAFTRALRTGMLDMGLVGHDPNQPFARASAGSLTLKQDNKGLWFSATPDVSPRSVQLISDIRSGNIKGVSFGFGDDTVDEWKRMADGTLQRTLLDIDAREISPTPFPAYEDTSVSVRSLAQVQAMDPTGVAEKRDGHPDDYSVVAAHARSMASYCRSLSEYMMRTRDVFQAHSGALTDDETQHMRDLSDALKNTNKRMAEVRDHVRSKLATRADDPDEEDDDDEDEQEQPEQEGEKRQAAPKHTRDTIQARLRLLELEQIGGAHEE